MNIEKLVSSYFDKKRSQSTKQIKNATQHSTSTRCCEPTQYLFQPMVNQIPKSLYRVTSKTQCSREDIVERLCTDRRMEENRRVLRKLDEDQRQFREFCTFQPRTSLASKRILKTECEEQNPFNRLYDDALTKKKLSETLPQSFPEQPPSFHPQTNYRTILNSQTCNMKPIYQRLDDIIKQKRDKMKMLQQDTVQKQMKAKPTINQISQKIVQNKEEFKRNILERVSGYIEEKRRKVQRDAVEMERNAMKECTFRPEINTGVDISSNFQTRQEEYLRKIQEKMTSRAVEHNFHPEINKISQILVRQEREAQTFEDKINRLSNNNYKTDRIQQIERQLYQQCTFVPEINVISKCLAAEHISHKCDHTPKEQEYEFKPKINKLSQKLAKEAKIRKAESADFRQDRQQYMNHLKMEMEYQELKQCTFKPKLNISKPKTNTNLTNIRGYESFVKKIDRINQLKQQQKQLKEKLFNKQKTYKNRKSTTPIEFKLSQGYNTKEAIKQEIRSKFEKQCTFRPQIKALR